MNKIADMLEKSGLFIELDVNKFRDIPQGDEYFGPVDYANRFLTEMWDLADFKNIWVEL